MPDLLSTVAILLFLRLSLCGGLIENRVANAKEFAPCGSYSNKDLLQSFAPNPLFGRSPSPQVDYYYTCKDRNGDPRKFSHQISCCEGGGVCAIDQNCCKSSSDNHCCDIPEDCCGEGCCRVGTRCCNGVCIPKAATCCGYPTEGTWCSEGYSCYYDLDDYSPYCCTSESCQNWDTVHIISGYDYGVGPPPTEITYIYYTRTVVWYYYVYYWIYIVIHETSSLTSERVTTTSIISVSATDPAEASELLNSSEGAIRGHTPVQTTTEIRSETPPPTPTSEPTPIETRISESESEEPSSASGRTTTAAVLPKTTSRASPSSPGRFPTLSGNSSDATAQTGSSAAGLNRLEPLSRVGGGGAILLSFLFGLAVFI
ncbi:uncharacterized protein DFL_002299 [Arthrobotrys flagrans]|uniref:Granulins domain-containing protein n=1 Tax=Arthrobotrys flagrans TaxID=97331 RepID=A0A437AAE4_ARTFL|nr:hypothetical protein DFL_002299 [Arthrobotrys flagrans]